MTMRSAYIESTAIQAFDGSSRSLRSVRRATVEALAGVDDELREHLVLMTCELATNAIRHARTPFVVTIMRSARRCEVRVTDYGSGEPVLIRPAPNESSGRGLGIVEILADEWGFARRGHGKTVWFRMRTVNRGRKS